MFSDTSILYYTNNLLSKDLLSYTLKEAIHHCKNNDCELILTSHYPLSEKYENTNISAESPLKKDPIYKYLVSQPIAVEQDMIEIAHQIFVTGKLPYSYLSIFKQLMLSLEKCKGENIVLMEHDCLYPDSYVSAVRKALINYKKNFSYCSFATCFLNQNGFFKLNNGSYCLSGCAGKKDLLMDVFSKKIALAEKNMPFRFEPIIDILDPVMSPDKYKDETIISGHICIDTFIREGCILDIKHNLNADGMLVSDKYFHQHPYWGVDKKYIDMIDVNSKAIWNYGTAKFNY